MKVILLRDVRKLGKKHDVKEVNEGFARNFLFPQKLAEPATGGKIAYIEENKKIVESTSLVQHELFVKAIQSLDGKVAVLSARANKEGHLYEGVKVGEIQNAIHTQIGVNLDIGHIHLTHPLKTIGEHAVSVGEGKVLAQVVVMVKAKE